MIAIPTNDRLNIAQKSGRAKEFAFFDINNVENVTFKENPHKHHDHSHTDGGHNHSHADMVDMFKNDKVNVIIVDVIGKHFKKDLFNEYFEIYKTDLTDLNEIALAFKEQLNNFTKIKED